VYTVSNGEFDGLHDGIVLTGGCALNVKVLGRSGWAVHNYDNNHNTDDVQKHTTDIQQSCSASFDGAMRLFRRATGCADCAGLAGLFQGSGAQHRVRARPPVVYVCIEMTALRAS